MSTGTHEDVTERAAHPLFTDEFAEDVRNSEAPARQQAHPCLEYGMAGRNFWKEMLMSAGKGPGNRAKQVEALAGKLAKWAEAELSEEEQILLGLLVSRYDKFATRVHIKSPTYVYHSDIRAAVMDTLAHIDHVGNPTEPVPSQPDEDWVNGPYWPRADVWPRA